ncbi:hypothetical protein MTHERMOG20_03710 [Moorella thermoacetica]|uniref:Uncharacterized protein n=2 Tax=Neomoorella thermoacetica TaxID=1525 RepID=A0AAC9HHL4_NEOTH|nr:hypothetical protein [Moorella thermoacetica]AKX94044.1 hypothetical protein MOTHE_c12500 [Moorella thermoacetica]AKX96683.1 hypothetical protein MOTHA_c13360 [Moorella thermoacetica]AOQ23995.1 hypothetical protein Maut_01555 [Moorella thermoacetica]APC08436.1 hypothetical protein MTJW_12760 [Moorella thermoacetica]OIQ57853.1 hypothetical protein MOCA_02770 [Moorella thermoacetica]
MADEVSTQQQVVGPGVCPPEGCPPPTRIECIVADKVYDSCFQVESRSRDTTVTTGLTGTFVTGTFTVGQPIPCAQAGPITCNVINRTPTTGNFATLTIVVSVPVTLTNPNAATETANRVFTFTKIVTLCAPEGVTVDCGESTLLFCNCVVSAVGVGNITVTCDFQVCVVIKTILTVQLLVPSYGFCVPAPCVVAPGVCPPAPPAQCF